MLSTYKEGTSHEMDCPVEPRHFQPIRTIRRGGMEAFGGSKVFRVHGRLLPHWMMWGHTKCKVKVQGLSYTIISITCIITCTASQE